MYKSVTVDLKLYSYNVKLYMALYIYIQIYNAPGFDLVAVGVVA
jgi:hypothetical protein